MGYYWADWCYGFLVYHRIWVSVFYLVAAEENCGGFYEVSVFLNAQLVCSGDFGGLLWLGRCLLVHYVLVSANWDAHICI